MKTIDRYILREWLGVLAMVAALTLGLLLIQALFDDFRDLLALGAGFADIAMYYAIKVPSFLAIVMPIIVLVSLLYSLGQLHRSHEITAMRAAGLGLFRITRSIWVVGIVLSGVMWVLNASVVPWSVEASRAIFENIEFRHQAEVTKDQDRVGEVRGVTFDNQREHRLWLINRFSRLTERARGIGVSEFDENGRELVRYFAKEGRFDRTRGCWVFYDGWASRFDPETGDVSHPPPFSEQVMKNYTEAPSLMLIFDLKPSDLSFFELRTIIDFLEAERSPKVNTYAMRYYGLLSDTVAPLIVILIAVSFSLTGVRVNPAVGVSKSLGLFVVYYICLQGANALGGRGIVDPAIAAAAPSVVMLVLGCWHFARLR